jgi:predicted transposase/invertase (TIGR01784 family)
MEELKDKYIRFDWAIKRLLRQKANFGVLEGFLTVFIGEPIKIIDILESEGNQQEADDKFNRVDIKAKNSKGDIIIVEIQNTSELYYLERVLYGVAKAITEHINLGNTYKEVKKVYSISILYFDLGKGSDYIYVGHPWNRPCQEASHLGTVQAPGDWRQRADHLDLRTDWLQAVQPA